MGRIFLALALAIVAGARAAEPAVLVSPAHRLAPGDASWREFFDAAEHRPDAAADFEERRYFPFKKLPTVLQGEVRVSATRGLSLHYLAPEERTVVIDDGGWLLRDRAGDSTPPSDPRAKSANAALLHLLRFDLRALDESFEVYGEREGDSWTLALVPRDESLRRTLGQIAVSGEKTAVRRIEMRRSPTQRVEILVGPPRSPVVFTADELRRFFR